MDRRRLDEIFGTPEVSDLKKTYSYEELTAQTLLASSNSVLNTTKEK